MVHFKFLIFYYITKWVSSSCNSTFNIYHLRNRCDSDCQKLIGIIMIWIDTIVGSYVLSCSVVSNSSRTHGLQHTRFPSPSPSLELAQTHVHWVSDAIQPSHPLPCPLLFLPSIFPSIRVFSSESVLPIRWPKYWSFSFSISPSNEYSELISFRIWLISLQSKGLSRVFSSTTVQKHTYFGSQPSLWSNSHVCTWLLEKL